MKWGRCDGKGAKCCDGFDCLEDPKSVEAAKEWDKKVEGMISVRFLEKEKFLPSRCLDCYPHSFHCDPDSDKKCCTGLTCGVNALGQNYECMESPICLTDLASCGLPGADCCPGYICTGQKKCNKCLAEREECLGNEKMCCDGTLCRIDETGLKWICSGKPICVEEEGSCEHIDSRCCEGTICNRNSKCEKLPTCLEEKFSCLPGDKPLPCCEPNSCLYDELGKTQSCNLEQPCILEGGYCSHKSVECCNGMFCDRGKCICGHEGEFCSEEIKCCNGLKCILDSWGAKSICGESQLCILEGGNCTKVDCCVGLICDQVKAKPVLDSNGTMYTPNITHSLCIKPETCVSKPWAECSVELNPCCEHLLCTEDVFEKGQFCHPKAQEGSQCLTDEYCNFYQDPDSPPMECVNNICTPKSRKCKLLAEECSNDLDCCYGHECVFWGEAKRCKKSTGYRCEYEDDCVKFCDPMRGVCCDEPV